MKVLCIDDDQDDLDLYREAVKKVHASHLCVVAQNGKEVIQLLETVKPDLVFLDINMPGLGGWELIKMIRAKRDYDHIPVYMLSTTRNAAELEIFARIGASGCLLKPGSFHELCLMFKSVITEREKG
jgi:CheY-like chemotaxis protein